MCDRVGVESILNVIRDRIHIRYIIIILIFYNLVGTLFARIYFINSVHNA